MGGPMTRERESVHTPVLVSEVLAAYAAERDPSSLEGWFVDGTFGAGGHARAVLEAFPRTRLFGIDQDPEVLEHGRRGLADLGDRVLTVRGRISSLAGLLAKAGIRSAVGVLFDLGANSLHFDQPERGFSFGADGPLDMRMDPDRERTAADIVNRWDEADLADLFYHEGGERGSRRIARAIVDARRRVPFQRTAALADLIASLSGGHTGGRGRTHPATRVFQALRRAVNDEGEELLHGLKLAEEILDHGAPLCVLTFHSGEDGVVKRFFQERARGGFWQLASKKPQGPGAAERRSNPRARSAQLRWARRLRAQAIDGGGEG